MPRGYAAPFPGTYDFDQDEFDRIAELAKLQLDDAKDELEEAQAEERAGNRAGETDEENARVKKSKKSAKKAESVSPSN